MVGKELKTTADISPDNFILGGESSIEEGSSTFHEKVEKYALPKFLEGEIRERLSVICLVGIFAGFVFPVVFSLLGSTEIGPRKHVLSAFGVTSVFFYFLIKRKKMSFSSLIYIGLIYGFLHSYFVACSQTVMEYTRDYTPRDIPTLAAVWISLFPLVVPFPPRKVFLISLLYGSSVLLAIKTGDFFFNTNPPFTLYQDTSIVYFFIGLFSCFMSSVVYKLHWEVAQERQKSSYELLDLLGEGNMGSVWRVRHRMLHRPAAMKVISSKYLDNSDKEKKNLRIKRFEREAKATASLSSPNSIVLYDFGLIENDSFYYVMELLEGKNLESITNEFGPVSAERAVYLLLQICRSLSDAHSKNLIHRDIKPANIMVCKYGVDYDFIKVLDFGMVKRSKQETIDTDHDATLTKVGTISGTPAFMAPEMIQQNPIDGRYDIYSLGCVAYWLLTGDLVFSSNSVMEIIVAHLETQPISPSCKTNAPVPEELDKIILWCLEKNPDDRPQTMDELAESLEKIEFKDPWDRKKAKAWWLEKEKT